MQRQAACSTMPCKSISNTQEATTARASEARGTRPHHSEEEHCADKPPNERRNPNDLVLPRCLGNDGDDECEGESQLDQVVLKPGASHLATERGCLVGREMRCCMTIFVPHENHV